VARGPEAPVSFVDDPVPARSRPWVDSEDSHEDTLGIPPDVPLLHKPISFGQSREKL
jgi:hypothetical protein